MAENAKELRRRQREHEARIVVHDVQTDRRRTDNRKGIIALVVAALVAVGGQVAFTTTGGFAASPAAETTAPVETAAPDAAVPDASIAEDREWTGTIDFNDGAFELGITLDGVNAPQATANLIDLAQKDFYDETSCHRLTTEGLYVLQCGDPSGDGTGGPGYQFGPLENIPEDGVYPAGTIAMARGQAEDSMGSQFFIVYEDTELPAPGYSVIGQVTSGLDELQAQIVDEGVDPSSGPTTDGTPVAPAVITDITVE
ncbi:MULTISPECIES: peptidylprolyl isomerase [Gulosibacter]|uniref:peptidylprolyl isomerase n=1 Tax=Gulosibacter TaxID=256818 RepID=UPI001F495867|nr:MULTISPECIES: peptidylprolyl isomerase [Gulosibacter]